MLSPQFVTNDFEKTFVYKENGLTFNLSKLVAAGDDPECYSIAAYRNGQDDPVFEIKFSGEKKELLRKWINL